MSIELRELRRGGYETARPEVQALVPRTATRILDLGCSSGALGAALKARQKAEVVGIELSPEYAAEAGSRLDEVICSDVAEALEAPGELGRFDCVIAADVLEHLVDPWTALQRATALLEPGGTAVVSLPNVRYALTFWTLLRRGTWPRDPEGLFDATHLRWFTLRDARELLEGAGLEIDAVEPLYWFHGWQLRVVRQLGRTPLAPFLAGQYVLRGRRAR
jgi:methionine biosynthesis protein MetW